MFWAESGLVLPDPDSTQFALVITKMSLPDPAKGFSACLSTYRRPEPRAGADPHQGGVPVSARRPGHRPGARARLRQRGDVRPARQRRRADRAEPHVRQGGVCITPVPNGTFLNGITRQRVIGLLRDAGIEVQERTVRPAELLEADEIFSTGNHGKVVPCLRYESRGFEAGPIYRQARELYWAFAHSHVAAPAAVAPAAAH